ncbi:MAG: hypothetical protein H7256_10405 [Bdellovibrio sp.]|nr:hypothetical protein [Bdellovibrio sp.]
MFFVFFAGTYAVAQSAPEVTKNKRPFPVKYTSEVDQKLSLHTITLAPVYDNVNRIYAEPIQKLLIELLQNDKVWGYSAFPDLNKKIFVETYDSKPQEVLDILNQTKTQGLLTAIITKGPAGMSIKLKLYTADQGLLFAEETFQDQSTFEIPKLREQVVTLYHNLKNKLPYRGFVLSRRGLDVTLNAGEKNGLVVGQEVALAQILKINRHPKLKYMVSTEKEIIGKLQITKVEPYLSFAQITFEKENGVVEVGAKLLPNDFIAYPLPVLNKDGDVVDDKLSNSIASTFETRKKETKVGDKVTETTMAHAGPQVGKFLLQGGFSQFSESANLTTGESPSASQSMAPTINLGLELWTTPNWFVSFELLQAIFKASNGLNGSSPEDLNYSYSKYSGSIGYYFLLNKDDDKTPKIGGQVGYASMKKDVTDTNPRAFTSSTTSGFLVKVNGAFPLRDYPVELGASFDIFLSPSTTESPAGAGSSSSRINAFGFNASYETSPSLSYRFDINFDQIQTDTTGGDATSSTEKMTNVLFGIEYSF